MNAAQTIAVFLFTAAKAYIGVFGIGSFLLYQGTIDRFVKAVCEITTEIGRLLHNNQYLVEMINERWGNIKLEKGKAILIS
jgi:hypothetical protein